MIIDKFIIVLRIKFFYITTFKISHLCKSLNLLANTRDKMAINLIRMFKAGPEVSFNGSPTVSPTTAALWMSVPFVTLFPF